MLKRIFRQLLLIPLIIFGFWLIQQLAIATSYGMDFKVGGEIDTLYYYYHYRDDTPDYFQDLMDLNNTLLKLSSSLQFDDYRYEFKISGNAEERRFYLDQATVCGQTEGLVVEAGKKDWIWGTGYSFTPTYPLDQDIAYWGGEVTGSWSRYNLALGTAAAEEEYEMDTFWLRTGLLFDTSDLSVIISSRKNSNGDLFNAGLSASKDFLNGFELHHELNVRHPGADCDFLIGVQYIGKSDWVFLLEGYHGHNNLKNYFSDNFEDYLEDYNLEDEPKDWLVLSINNFAAVFKHWQWEIREVVNLSDSGEIRMIRVKYNKDDRITPELKITNYVGPSDSQIGMIPFDLEVLLQITVKF